MNQKKRKPGRPIGWKKPDGSKKPVTIRLHPSVIKKLKTMAKKGKKSQAEIVADALSNFDLASGK